MNEKSQAVTFPVGKDSRQTTEVEKLRAIQREAITLKYKGYELIDACISYVIQNAPRSTEETP